jgi:hypothetical protein
MRGAGAGDGASAVAGGGAAAGQTAVAGRGAAAEGSDTSRAALFVVSEDSHGLGFFCVVSEELDGSDGMASSGAAAAVLRLGSSRSSTMDSTMAMTLCGDWTRNTEPYVPEGPIAFTGVSSAGPMSN